MAIRTRIEPISRDIQILVREELSPAGQAKAVADYARAEFKKTDDLNRQVLGRQAPSTTTVDGRSGAPLDSVKPNGGVIIFEWEIVADVLVAIGQMLIDRSPVVSGAYRRSHTLFADGREVAINAQVPPAQEYVFINPVPYARKIEVGQTKAGRAFVIQVENHIYERTARDANARFGNIAKIAFAYRSLVGGPIGQWAASASARRVAARARRGNPVHHTDWLTRQPAIVVTLR
jgi:hypothetical protein